MKYLLKLSYLGTNYCGFQVQDNADTVQARLCAAGKTLLGAECAVSGCSRTDSGVHAREYYATLSCDGGANVPADKFPRAINTFLPCDISVSEAYAVPEDFSVRRAVTGKEYEYLIHTGKTPDPFLCDRALEYPHALDTGKMRAAAEEIVGKHDFACFMAAGSDICDTVRTVTSLRVEQNGENVSVFVSADGFLYNMVRIITGTLIEVSEGKISPDDIGGIIASKDRTRAGRTVPAKGLYLNKVFITKA